MSEYVARVLLEGEPLKELLEKAWNNRQSLFQQAEQEGGDCYRVFHGTVEGIQGLSIDCYGTKLLVQSFHHSISPS